MMPKREVDPTDAEVDPTDVPAEDVAPEAVPAKLLAGPERRTFAGTLDALDEPTPSHHVVCLAEGQGCTCTVAYALADRVAGSRKMLQALAESGTNGHAAVAGDAPPDGGPVDEL